MNRFVKDNLVLFIIMGCTILGAVILLTFAVIGHARMYSYYAEAEELRSQIEQLIKQVPAPVQGNEAPIKEETAFYKAKTAKILPHFGQIKGPSLDAFIYTLLMKKENDRAQDIDWTKVDRKKLEETKQKFLETFRAAWSADEDRKSQGGRQRFYQRFVRGLIADHNWAAELKLSDAQRTARWKNALEAFRNEYQKLTIERLDESNQDDILMSVLGVPRNYDGRADQCMQFFMVPMLSRMQEICANPPQRADEKPKDQEKKQGEQNAGKDDKDAPSKMELLGDAFYFGFKNIYVPRDRNSNATLPPEQIADVVKNWEVIGNLVSRMATEGISSLNSFIIRNMAGEKIGRYVIYHYTFSVTGDIAKIRALVQNLNNAAHENRMYIIRSIFLYADRDGAQEIFLERQQEVLQKLEGGKDNPQAEAAPAEPASAPTPAARPRRGRRGMDDMPPEMGMEQPPAEKVKTPAQIRAEELKKPYDKRMGYGRTLFGGSRNCEAVFDVEYVYLAEPELD